MQVQRYSRQIRGYQSKTVNTIHMINSRHSYTEAKKKKDYLIHQGKTETSPATLSSLHPLSMTLNERNIQLLLYYYYRNISALWLCLA